MTAMKSADVMARFEKAGGRPLALGGEDARLLVRKDVERWGPLIQDAGIKAD